MRLGITGTREGMSPAQKELFEFVAREYNPTEFHHGDCEGADAEAHDIIRHINPSIRIVVHPPIYPYRRAYKKGDEMRPPYDYIPRDKNIVNEINYLIGAPLTDEEIIRSGTWTTIRYAKKIGREYLVLPR